MKQITIRTYAVLILLLLPSDTFAQRLDLPTIVFSAVLVGDHVSTYRNLQAGGQENNPMYRFAKNDPLVIIGTGTALSAAGLIAWQRLTKKHRRIYLIGVYGMAALEVVFTVRNIQHYKRPTRTSRY